MTATASIDFSQVNIRDVNLLDPYLYSHGEPHAVWAALRHQAPVHWQQVDDKLGFWSITKYRDVVQVLKDYKTFTSERGNLLSLLGKDDPSGGKQMAVTDPPRHTQMRRAMHQFFTPDSILKHEDQIRQEIRKLVLPSLEDEGIDFARAAFALSICVGGCILELPSEDWPTLTRLTIMSVAPEDEEFKLADGDITATLQLAHRELFGYFQDIVKQRRRSPGDDLVSALLQLEIDGEKMDIPTVISNCYSILLGATATTPHVASSTLLEQTKINGLEELAAHPESMDSFVEEAFRWSSPGSHFLRYATIDTEIRGVPIKEGDAVAVWVGSANRDEEIFADPYTFNMQRHPNPHISFGTGVHHCIGSKIAKHTMTFLFDELATNFTHFDVIGPVEYLGSNFISGIKHMPVRGYQR
ncbi:cytochrome P450 [Paenibacillus oleatilyticus]|uniref:Cytochrome P450 n=1 Tax=Paenibacillus oleatilyticus TaxID=2594886 RepID=A0ABV4VBP8_9BACL